MIKRNFTLWLVAILILAGGLMVRVYGLDKSPPSLGFDEAALGYNAYSLMKTGKDEYGNFLPLSLRSFNDFKPALYAYLTIPFIKIFGLNAVGVRMVSALSGVVSLLFLFLLLKEFFKNKNYLLFIFFILSFEPWRLHFSRNALETNLSATLFLMCSYFLLTLKKNKKWWLSILFFGLSAYSYHSARLSVPLLLIFWIFDPIKLIVSKNIGVAIKRSFGVNWKKLGMVVAFALICMPIFMANSGSLVLTRFKQENVFNRFYPYAPKEVLNPVSFGYYFGGIVSGHVFSHISPINLSNRIFNWVRMSPQFIPGMGMLGWVESIIFVIGFWYLIENILKSARYRFLIYWMVAGVAPAAATWTWFHPLRSLNIYPAVEIIVAIGAFRIFEYFNKNINRQIVKKVMAAVVGGICVLAIIFTINNELLYSAVENNGEYQPGGYKEGMPLFMSLSDKYSRVIIDTPHAQGFIFFLFYSAFDPATIQKYASLRPQPGVEGNLNFDFDKYIFRKVDWPVDYKLKNTIFWTRADITDAEVNRIDGAKVEKRVWNALYETASIITTE